MKRGEPLMNLCTASNISLFISYDNDLYSCNTKSILFFSKYACMDSNKTNLKLNFLNPHY